MRRRIEGKIGYRDGGGGGADQSEEKGAHDRGAIVGLLPFLRPPI